MTRERRIKENGIDYCAEYDDKGRCWRLTSREKILYKGEIRLIEEGLFCATAFPIEGSEDLNLVWTPVEWNLNKTNNQDSEALQDTQ